MSNFTGAVADAQASFQAYAYTFSGMLCNNWFVHEGAFLPDDWNGRFAVVGNGGQAGGVNWPAMGTMVKYGFAVISTNTGHESASDDASWMTMGEEAIIDNAYRAMHLSIVNGKEIVQKYYGRNISKSNIHGQQ